MSDTATHTDTGAEIVPIDLPSVRIERDAMLSTLGAVPAGHPNVFRFPTRTDALAAATLIAMCPRLRANTPAEDGTLQVGIVPGPRIDIDTSYPGGDAA